MKLKQKFIDFLNDNKIVYLTANDEKSILIRYKSLIKDVPVNIIVLYMDEIDILSFNMAANIKQNCDINKVQTTLLDMNSKLIYGNLSIRNDSNTIVHTNNYSITDEDSVDPDKYTKIILQCLDIHRELYELGFIEGTEAY